MFFNHASTYRKSLATSPRDVPTCSNLHVSWYLACTGMYIPHKKLHLAAAAFETILHQIFVFSYIFQEYNKLTL